MELAREYGREFPDTELEDVAGEECANSLGQLVEIRSVRRQASLNRHGVMTERSKK